MQHLKFNRLLVLSNSEKLANQFVFDQKMNLITAKANNVGKTTLVKLILWGMGCEPIFDNAWKKNDCRTLIEFSVQDRIYFVHRYKDIIALKSEKSNFETYDKISGDYSQKIAEILAFKALLTNRKTELVTPPPAYYFVPFYIDQKKSWSEAWNNFDKLSQFQDWKETIIKYHVGLLPAKHFELEQQIAEKKEEIKTSEENIDRFDTSLNLLKKYVPKERVLALNIEHFEKMTDEIQNLLQHLQSEQEVVLNEMTELNIDFAFLTQQVKMTEQLIIDLEEDYKFAVENIESDVIECPLCGVVHDNSILNRTSIKTDKEQAKRQFETLTKALAKVNKKRNENREKLNLIKSKIQKINSKYVLNPSDNQPHLDEIIQLAAGNSIRDNMNADKNLHIIELKNLKDYERKLKQEQRGLLSKSEKDTINKRFIIKFQNYLEELESESVNLSEISTPLDYNKVIKEGGAADNVRSILAYYFTIYKMIQSSENEVLGPIIIDTPNQQEQSQLNYNKIINVINNSLSENQVFLCAMESEHINFLKEKAKVFELDRNKILHPEKYTEVHNEFHRIGIKQGM